MHDTFSRSDHAVLPVSHVHEHVSAEGMSTDSFHACVGRFSQGSLLHHGTLHLPFMRKSNLAALRDKNPALRFNDSREQAANVIFVALYKVQHNRHSKDSRPLDTWKMVFPMSTAAADVDFDVTMWWSFTRSDTS